MSLICEKCGEVLVDGKEHPTPADCLASLKELTRRVRKSFSEATLDISKCRSERHRGRQVIGKLNLCVFCLGAGFAAYQVGHEIVTSGLIPKAESVKR